MWYLLHHHPALPKIPKTYFSFEVASSDSLARYQLAAAADALNVSTNFVLSMTVVNELAIITSVSIHSTSSVWLVGL